jgi:AraC-like DNA-binding protein
MKRIRGSTEATSLSDMAGAPLELGMRAGGNWLHDVHQDHRYLFFLDARRKRLPMATYADETLAVATMTLRRSQDWVHHVINLLDAAMHQLYRKEKSAQGTILQAASLLRQQLDPPAPQETRDGRGRLLAWQARKVRDYIDAHITGPVLVADLCAIVHCSEAHFSRSFKRTFGESPHAFLVRRRVELAAQYMLTTDASLTDIALQCGFADQAHLCKRFGQAAGQTPAAWRRAYRSHHDEDGTSLSGLTQFPALSPEPLLRTGS